MQCVLSRRFDAEGKNVGFPISQSPSLGRSGSHFHYLQDSNICQGRFPHATAAAASSASLALVRASLNWVRSSPLYPTVFGALGVDAPQPIETTPHDQKQLIGRLPRHPRIELALISHSW